MKPFQIRTYYSDRILIDGTRVSAKTYQILWGRLGEDDWKHAITVSYTTDHGKQDAPKKET